MKVMLECRIFIVLCATAMAAMAATQPAAAEPVARIKIALYKGPGTGGSGPPELMKMLNESNVTTAAVEVSRAEIRAGVLTNFDVVIFAGGSGSAEAKALGRDGRMRVQTFVANGGGYIGICAGAYLATSGFPWSLHLINARTLSPKWQRGRAVLQLELTAAGEEIFGGSNRLKVLYHQGPVVGPAGVAGLPPYEPLAWFRTEVSSNGTPKGIQMNSPAIFVGTFEKGRVLCISPHPEQTAGLEYVVPRAAAWVARRAGP